jgi:hypothetical protein
LFGNEQIAHVLLDEITAVHGVLRNLGLKNSKPASENRSELRRVWSGSARRDLLQVFKAQVDAAGNDRGDGPTRLPADVLKSVACPARR